MSGSLIPEFLANGVSKEIAENLWRVCETRIASQRFPANPGGDHPRSSMASGSNKVLLCASPSDAAFSKAIEPNCAGIFEFDEGKEITRSADQIIELLSAGCWFASICSRSIFKSSFVDVFSQKIVSDSRKSPDEITLMRTAIDEALINSVTHGNLELKMPLISNIDEFSAYYEKIDERIGIDEYAMRHITFQYWINDDRMCVSIADEGPGYIPYTEKRTQKADPRKSPAVENRKSGRGIDIIKSIARETLVDRQGRRITMIF